MISSNKRLKMKKRARANRKARKRQPKLRKERENKRRCYNAEKDGRVVHQP